MTVKNERPYISRGHRRKVSALWLIEFDNLSLRRMRNPINYLFIKLWCSESSRVVSFQPRQQYVEASFISFRRRGVCDFVPICTLPVKKFLKEARCNIRNMKDTKSVEWIWIELPSCAPLFLRFMEQLSGFWRYNVRFVSLFRCQLGVKTTLFQMKSLSRLDHPCILEN